MQPQPTVTGPQAQDLSSVLIKLERGPCYGFCPIYSVEIHGDGTVVYDGINFVGKTGRQTGAVSLDDVRALLAKFDAVGFFGLEPAYRGTITDGATYTLSLSRDGRTGTVIDYMGAMAGMPRAVIDLENAIDITAGTKKWTDGYVPRPPPH